MSVGRACLTALLALQAGESTAPSTAPIDWVNRLAPRAAVAGMRGFECVSVVRFAAEPQTPHELTCTYVFPDRARWQLRVRGQDELGRHIEYRCGDTFFVLPQGAPGSIEISSRTATAEVRAAKCEPMELRRALFLWPDGFEWRESNGARRAASVCGRELEALLDAQGRPKLLHWADSGPEGAEVLTVGSWKERQGRWWPDALDLSVGGQAIWSERVESLATSVELLDQFFVPPDLRSAPDAPRVGSAVQHVDTPSRHEFRIPLAQDCDWPTAVIRWQAESKRLTTELPSGWALAPGAYACIGRDGRPTELLLRVRGSGAPPRGVTYASSQQALLVADHWPGADLEQVLVRISAAAPTGATIESAYVGFPGDLAASGQIQIVATLRATR